MYVMEAALNAMPDPTRREILRLIQNEELPAGAIASNFPVSRPAISQHLSVLKSADLIDERRSGVKRLYRTRMEGMAGLVVLPTNVVYSLEAGVAPSIPPCGRW